MNACETRMNDRSELVKEARALAVPIPTGENMLGSERAQVLLKLADIVEQRDKEPRFAANIKALREQIDALARRIAGQAVNEELVAACKVCDEAIAALLTHPFAVGNDSVDWCNLRAARHLAIRAAEKAEKVDCEECVKAEMVQSAIAKLETRDTTEWVDLDEFKAKGGESCSNQP